LKEEIYNYLYIIPLTAVLICIFYLMKKYKNSIKSIYGNKRLILGLVKNDFKVKYAGSYLGVIWAFVQPVITILLYWIVFEYGLRVVTTDTKIPFAIWLITGMIPWFFIADAVSNGSNGFYEYNYLVKKVVFQISIIPFIKVLSSLLVHFVFMVFLMFIYMLYNSIGTDISFPTIYLLQLPYYTICAIVLSLGIVYITSSITVFFKDLAQFITIMLQIGMWATPVLWNQSIVPDEYKWIIYANPANYIVEGYRSSMAGGVWFWELPYQSLWFWACAVAVFAAGMVVFKRLKPHFADVL